MSAPYMVLPDLPHANSSMRVKDKVKSKHSCSVIFTLDIPFLLIETNIEGKFT